MKRTKYTLILSVKWLASWMIKMSGCWILGTVLMIGVYLLPVNEMMQNVARSSEIYNYEGVYPQLIHGYKFTQLDNYTDSIMLGAAIYNGNENVLKKAMNNYHVYYEEIPSVLTLTNYANYVDFEYQTVSYGRYWHGYLVVLKPLLLLFEVSDIRVLNFILQSILLFIIFSLFYTKKVEKYLIGFACTIFLLNPLANALSFQFSTVYYIILLSCIYVLKNYKKTAVLPKLDNLFFFIGVATSFFDFLTYPLAGFGIVLVLFILLYGEQLSDCKLLKELLKLTLLWGVGYAGMWLGKWIVGSILLENNLILEGINQALFRTSDNLDLLPDFTRKQAILKNVSVLFKWPFLLMFGGVFLYLAKKIVYPFKQWKNLLRQKAIFMISLCAVGITPFIWYIVLANHSQIHYWFTYRVLSISVFAFLGLMQYIKTVFQENGGESK